MKFWNASFMPGTPAALLAALSPLASPLPPPDLPKDGSDSPYDSALAMPIFELGTVEHVHHLLAVRFGKLAQSSEFGATERGERHGYLGLVGRIDIIRSRTEK